MKRSALTRNPVDERGTHTSRGILAAIISKKYPGNLKKTIFLHYCSLSTERAYSFVEKTLESIWQ
jgi:hypothetical protein